MNFIKIPQLLIPILFVALSLSNAFAFAAEEEEIVAFQSELPSDASTYTIKQQGEHWNSPGWRIEGYTKEYVKFRAWRYFFYIIVSRDGQLGPLLGFGRRRAAMTDISLSFHSLYVSLSFSLVKYNTARLPQRSRSFLKLACLNTPRCTDTNTGLQTWISRTFS